DGMQPMLRHVPPKVPRLSMQALFSPSWPARMAALYPPGPPPMTTTSNCWAISDVQQQALRVFEVFLHAHEERYRFAAIDQAVIVGQRQIHHRADFHLVVDSHRPLLDLVHT